MLRKRFAFMKKYACCFFPLLFISCENRNERHSIVYESNPVKDGYVPNQKTAIKIAEAVWLPIYGEDIYKEKPFEAVLLGDTLWLVTGTLYPKGTEGGTLIARIQKSNGKILEVTHEK
jgi:hypothetical protein